MRRKAERKREREDSRDPCIGGGGGGSGSDPDEFFRRFPGDFLFFPVVTSGAVGRSLQTIRSKIFTASQPPHSPLLRHGPPRGREGGGGQRVIQTRGMAAACSRKPINLYRLPSTISSSLVLENILRRADVYLRSGLYLYFRLRIDSRPGY